MKKILFLLSLLPLFATAREAKVSSPDGKLTVTVNDNGGLLTYAVDYDGQTVLKPSRLGLKTNFGDFTQGLSISNAQNSKTSDSYQMRQTKQSAIAFDANTMTINLLNANKQRLSVEFFVKDNDLAFRYLIPTQEKGNPKCAVVTGEVSSFCFPTDTKTFICPQIDPMKGWERTKPSYEEEYKPDAPVNVRSQFGQGYTFPCLFRTPVAAAATPNGSKGKKTAGQPTDLWVLISETGVSSNYCGTHLSDYSETTGYTIAFPQAGENNGSGSATAAMSLPGETPWRTVTVGTNLKPVVETTIPYDVVKPLYEPSEDYRYGRYTWSWLIWQDASINWDDQIQFIDLAAQMGYEYCLVDGCWDTEIGRDRMPELSSYARKKGVALMLWYNSNGAWNDAPQTPRNRMDNSIARDKEMKWLKEIGVKGIKVDFFAGDKQETMKLYEDILFDANRYGIQVIFHGCTLPRGWERMYPNYISSEAVLASENVYFSDYHAMQEPFQLTMHPFCRNAVATMDWGGVIMNRYMSRDNKSRHQRQTTDAFELATAFTNQAAIQCIAMQPNNLKELPEDELNFLRQIPTTWDETRFVDGYPGKYAVLARRHGSQWYVAGINATKEPLTLSLSLPMFAAGSKVTLLNDKVERKVVGGIQISELKTDKKGQAKVVIQPNGGCVIY